VSSSFIASFHFLCRFLFQLATNPLPENSTASLLHPIFSCESRCFFPRIRIFCRIPCLNPIVRFTSRKLAGLFSSFPASPFCLPRCGTVIRSAECLFFFQKKFPMAPFHLLPSDPGPLASGRPQVSFTAVFPLAPPGGYSFSGTLSISHRPLLKPFGLLAMALTAPRPLFRHRNRHKTFSLPFHIVKSAEGGATAFFFSPGAIVLKTSRS